MPAGYLFGALLASGMAWSSVCKVTTAVCLQDTELTNFEAGDLRFDIFPENRAIGLLGLSPVRPLRVFNNGR